MMVGNILMKVGINGLICALMVSACNLGVGEEEEFVPSENSENNNTIYPGAEGGDVSYGAPSYAVKTTKNTNMGGSAKYYLVSDAVIDEKWSDGTNINDSISSIHVYPGYEVIVYRHSNFKGSYKLFSENSSPTKYYNLANLEYSDGTSIDNTISSIEIRGSRKPKGMSLKGKDPDDSEFGDEINVDGIQGIAHSNNYWFLSKTTRIYKCNKDNIKDKLKSFSLDDLHDKSSVFKPYNHFGDMDFYKGLLYIAVSSDDVGSIILVLDENLNYKKYGKLPKNIVNKSGWVAINPVNGLLHATSEYRKLKTFKLDFGDADTLSYLFSIDLDFGSLGHSEGSWWNDVWNQGGAFDSDGILYYMLDHASDEDSNFTGIYRFYIVARQAHALGRMNIKYDPDRWIPFVGWKRKQELEGITVWDRGSHSKYGGKIHALFLSNEADEDDVTFFHFNVSYGTTPPDPTCPNGYCCAWLNDVCVECVSNASICNL